MSDTISGVEGLRIAEHIVAQFHASAVKQKAGAKHVKDMATCLKVLRGLIKVGDRLREDDPDLKPGWVRLGPDRQPEAVEDDIPQHMDDNYVPGEGQS